MTRWPEQTCRLVKFPFSQLIVLTQPVFTKRQVPWRCSLRSSKDKVLVAGVKLPTGEVSLQPVDCIDPAVFHKKASGMENGDGD